MQYYLDRLPAIIRPALGRFLEIESPSNVIRALRNVLLSAGFDKATGLSTTDISCLIHAHILAQHSCTIGEALEVPRLKYSDGENLAELVDRIGLENFFGETESKWLREELEKNRGARPG